MSALTKSHLLYPTQRIHMPAFFAALVLAPIIITGATFWLVVPVFAVVIGAPAYLGLGLPLLIWHLSRAPCNAGEIAALAFVSNFTALCLTTFAAFALGKEQIVEATIFYFGFGLIFAPLWGWMFGLLYNRFTRNAA
ncbi:hypothetical protein [Lentibacter sp. XHP0401]|uniref:hypothetical protein n=1 Tax=Lentibacter sp. XHP0401 TaxID=2984334 RepID=UPI0021E7A242|nr:hypothetical protein [Lentibacter sp. XHP0401]MCV2892909.1 hypothetical protein [Lentibacter sp. XHP0401]